MLKLKNMMRATYLTKLANIPKLIDGGHIERASLVKPHPPFRSAEFGKKKYLKTTQFEV